MSNPEAIAKLEAWRRNLLEGAKVLPNIAQGLVPVLEQGVTDAVKGQRSMDGSAWLKTKAGTPALKNAASAITVTAGKRSVDLVMTGHHVIHQVGTSRLPRRPVFPSAVLDDKLGRLIREGIVEMTEEWLTRDGRHDKGSGKMRVAGAAMGGPAKSAGGAMGAPKAKKGAAGG